MPFYNNFELFSPIRSLEKSAFFLHKKNMAFAAIIKQQAKTQAIISIIGLHFAHKNPQQPI